MIITVASGKGGTGKTTVATGMALSLAAEMSAPPLFLDCDVEAPNAHLFLHPQLEQQIPVCLLVPSVDRTLCTYCGKCAEVCQYHAIAVLGKKTLVFSQLCHGCGSCMSLCPEHAISEIPSRMGVLEHGAARSGILFSRGVLDVGEPMAVPVIRQLLAWQQPDIGQVTLRDAPPGTSCPVVASMRSSDFILFVTEPTPFGLHDLKLAVQVAKELSIPAGVIINRDGMPYPALDSYCSGNDLPVLMRIPLDRAIAQGVAQGKTLLDVYPEYQEAFCRVYAEIVRLVKANATQVLISENE